MRGRGPGFGEVLGVAEFRALWAAELFSILGDQLARVALALLVFRQTSSAALTALTYALTFAPAVLGGALLSGLADRFPRKLVLVITDLLRTALAAAMAIPGLPLPVLWILVGLLTMAGGPFKAAQLALLPLILTGERYVAGLSLRQITGQSAQLVGFASGGLLLAAVEPHIALVMNAATFLVSAVLVMTGVRPRPAARATAAAAGATDPSAPGAGRGLLPVITLMCLAGLFVVPEGLAAPYGTAITVGSIGVGLLMAADPLGSVVGAWLTARARRPPSALSAVLLAAASGIPLLVCAPGPGLVLSITLWAISGALSTAYLIQTQAILVSLIPDHHRGRVMGRVATCLYTSQGLTIVVAGVAAQAVGPFRTVAAAGLLGIVLALCVGAWWRPVARSRRDLAAGSERDAQTLGSHQMSLLATTDTSSRTDRQRGNDTRKPTSDQMSLLATTGTSFHGDCRTEPDMREKNADQMSLLATPATSSPTEHDTREKDADQMSLLATPATSSPTEHDTREKDADQMSLLATPATSSPTEHDTREKDADQMSLLATPATSSPTEHDTREKDADQMSLLATPATSSPTEHDTREKSADQMSLLATPATSSPTEHDTREKSADQMSLLATPATSIHRDHQPAHDWENNEGQMSLLATTGASSLTEHDTGGEDADQMSLLATPATSFQANCWTTRRAGSFVEKYAGRGIVDWGRKRPHYGGASG